MTNDGRFWETKPLKSLDRAQWEALCDGCGKCCLHKLEDEDTGELLPTNVACRLLDRRMGMCSDYKHRHAYVAECVRLTPRLVDELEWLPSTCAYRLRGEADPISGRIVGAWLCIFAGLVLLFLVKAHYVMFLWPLALLAVGVVLFGILMAHGALTFAREHVRPGHPVRRFVWAQEVFFWACVVSGGYVVYLLLRAV